MMTVTKPTKELETLNPEPLTRINSALFHDKRRLQNFLHDLRP